MQEERKVFQSKSRDEGRYISVNEINRKSQDVEDKFIQQKENDPFTANLINQLVQGTSVKQMMNKGEPASLNV